MSKKQSSLLNFFKSSGTPTSSPQTSTPNKSRVPKELKKNVEDSPLLTQCNREKSMSPIKLTGKRRRIVLSDEEDEENLAKRPLIKNEPTTPKTPKTASRRGEPTSKLENITQIEMDMAESFINSFRFNEAMNTTMNESVLERTIDFEKNKELAVETERYVHEDLDWLKIENIRDSNKKRPTDPDYDPTTLFVPADFLKTQTPGHRQWWQIKSANYDVVLLFKVGKFYELYHMDAVTAVTCLGLSYMRGNYAHCGFPEAAYGKFADQLVARGHKVARVEQTETPQQLEERNKKGQAKEKVVKRELCRITTSATKTYDAMDGETGGADSVDQAAKYLFAIKEDNSGKLPSYGICFIDTAIGQFNFCQFEDDEYRSFLRTNLAKYSPTQLLLEKNHISHHTMAILNTMLASVPKEYLITKKQFVTAEDTVFQLCKAKYLDSSTSNWPLTLKSMLDENSTVPKPAKSFELVWSSIGAILGYLERCLIDVDMVTMKNFVKLDSSLDTSHQKVEEISWNNRKLVLDGITIFNLNLLPSNDHQVSNMSLYNIINHCSTPFGRRLLRQWICSPTCDPITIKKRQDAIELITSTSNGTQDMKKITEILRELPDLERLLQKIHTCGLKYRAEIHPDSRANLFEATKYNSRKIKNLALAVEGFSGCLKIFKLESGLAEIDENELNSDSRPLLNELLSMSKGDKLEAALSDFKHCVDLKKAFELGKVEPNPGVDEDYDDAAEQVVNCIKELENYRKEQQKLLKCEIAYWGSGKNRYQMEIPDTKQVGGSYELKSRKKGYGRYYTSELVKLIENLDAAEAHKEKQSDESARKVFEEFDKKRFLWSQIVESIATLDVIFSLVKYAQSSSVEVCRPEFDYNSQRPYVDIENGSHPCLVTQIGTGNVYIANDTLLGGDKPSTMLLTGPNMGGKSTLMRQVAVLTVLAHMGSLVPAKSMKLSPVDRIFTRIGANDRIMCGQSTFFVEMNETQIIMRDATIHSLVLVDELGRGTSTFDGTAIASAVLADFADRIRCRTFFSTHYHSLCTSAASNNNIIQAHMACMVENENEEDPTEECVTFLYKLTEGACPKSYGFYAAKLAGIRDEVIREAHTASSRIARTTVLDAETRKRLREAAESGVSVEELRRMVDAL